MTKKYLWGSRMKEAIDLQRGGLKEGEDYNTVYGDDDVVAVKPLTFKGMKTLGSKGVAGTQARWWVAMEQGRKAWELYTRQGFEVVVVIDNSVEQTFRKVAVLIEPDGKTSAYSWDDRPIVIEEVLPESTIQGLSRAGVPL